MAENTRLILATITPKPGTLKEIVELYQGIIQHSATKEPGTFEWQLFTQVNPEGVEELFTIERFKNMEAALEHQKGPEIVKFNKAIAEKDLLAKPIVVNLVKPVSSFYL